MASTPPPAVTSPAFAPVTEEAFVADRKAFLHTFLNFTTFAVVFVVVVLVLLAIFLVW